MSVTRRPAGAAGDHHDELDGVGDEVGLGTDAGALGEAMEGGDRVVGVDGGAADGMARAPGFVPERRGSGDRDSRVSGHLE